MNRLPRLFLIAVIIMAAAIYYDMRQKPSAQSERVLSVLSPIRTSAPTPFGDSLPTHFPFDLPTTFSWLHIDPQLSPSVENSLTRLTSCSPEAFSLIQQYVTTFRYQDDERCLYCGDGIVAVGSWWVTPHYTCDVDQFMLMLAIAHEARHAWQDNQPETVSSSYDGVSGEKDAYAYELGVFDDCAFTMTDVDYVPRLRSVVQQWTRRPPGYSTTDEGH